MDTPTQSSASAAVAQARRRGRPPRLPYDLDSPLPRPLALAEQLALLKRCLPAMPRRRCPWCGGQQEVALTFEGARQVLSLLCLLCGREQPAEAAGAVSVA